MSIGLKTTGMLLNEIITTGIKAQQMGEKPEFLNRLKAIGRELETRDLVVNNERTERYNSIDKLYGALADTLVEMWFVVEEITSIRNIEEKNNEDWERLGKQADKAYKLNAERTEYIRRIDAILGEEEYTFLEKSYN